MEGQNRRDGIRVLEHSLRKPLSRDLRKLSGRKGSSTVTYTTATLSQECPFDSMHLLVVTQKEDERTVLNFKEVTCNCMANMIVGMANMIVAVYVYSSVSFVSKGFAELLLSLTVNQCYPSKVEIFLAATKVFFCGLLSNTCTH